MQVFGTVAPGFELVRDGFATGQSYDAGGAQLAVYHHGIKVVDIWAGNDPIRKRPLDGEGLHLFASATKGLTATVVHMLAQKGLMDLDASICKYWPEFAKNGKENITVKMVLTHTSGCTALPAEDNIKAPDAADWPKIIRCLEEMKPLYEPGTAVLYAPYTFGYLIGEVVRRATGKTIGTILHEEIAGPLDLNLWIGLPESKEDLVIPNMRSTPLKLPFEVTPVAPHLPFDTSDPLVAAYLFSFSSVDTPDFIYMNTREAHAVEVPAANGIGDARSLAKFYAHVIGEVDGKPPLLTAETLRRATTAQTDGLPPAGVFKQRHTNGYFRFAFGYEKKSILGQPMLGESSFGHVGAGGRLGFADIDSGVTVGYICNNMVWDSSYPDPRWMPWMDALAEIVEQKEHV